ncbi:MAG: cytochrome c [Paracoccaceae bacterium]
MRRLVKTMAIGLSVCAIGSAILAQDVPLGATEFEARCAVCHGKTGAGDGIVGELFDRKPKNLTLLAKENGGVFPFDAVYQSIDGRREIAGHGGSKMPIWGDYFMAESLKNDFGDDNAYLLVQGRVLSLVYFLQSIQAK